MRYVKYLWRLLKEFFAFARQNKAWWIIPLVVILLLMALFVVAGQVAGPMFICHVLNAPARMFFLSDAPAPPLKWFLALSAISLSGAACTGLYDFDLLARAERLVWRLRGTIFAC